MGELQSLHDDGSCDFHFIQEIGIDGCESADHTVAEKLLGNPGNKKNHSGFFIHIFLFYKFRNDNS